MKSWKITRGLFAWCTPSLLYTPTSTSLDGHACTPLDQEWSMHFFLILKELFSHRPDPVGSKAYCEFSKGSPVRRNSEAFFARGCFLKQFWTLQGKRQKLSCALLHGQCTGSIVPGCAQYYIRLDTWDYIFHLHTELLFFDKASPLASLSS